MQAAAKLKSRVLTWHALFSIGTAASVSFLSPALLLLKGALYQDALIALFCAVAAGGVASFVYALGVLERHRYLLRALALGSGAIEPSAVADLGDSSSKLTLGWIGPTVASLSGAVLLRPSSIDLTMAINLSLLGSVIAAAASLPFYVLLRSEVCDAVELTPPEIMREVLDRAERTSLPERRVARRILAATATPVAFLALGSALIANAHLRRAEERQREQTARLFARAALDPSPSVLAFGGMEAAIERASELGFRARTIGQTSQYRMTRDAAGMVELVVPIGKNSAVVRYRSTTGSVLSGALVTISLAAVAVAALIGLVLGKALTADLKMATRGVQLLGTEAVLSGSNLRQPRFRAVAALIGAVERLALRFRVFAEAQVRAIEAREAATRMRGLFFASVSHDLKSPLNAILGFSELVRRSQPLTFGQLESLDLIERRGRELLALVETILDAARVEAGHLKLVHDHVQIGDLLAAAIDKGRDLGGDEGIDAVAEFAPDVPPVRVDRVRMGQALATFIGHALRTAERSSVRVRASVLAPDQVALEVDIPSRRFSARQLEAMLNPGRQPGTSPHRGLALALGLARSMVELHGGSVRVEERANEGAAFLITLPVDSERHVDHVTS